MVEDTTCTQTSFQVFEPGIDLCHQIVCSLLIAKATYAFMNCVSQHYIPSLHHTQMTMNVHHTLPLAHRNLITARISQFPDDRGIGKSIFEHAYNANNIIIRRDYFYTSFVYLRQHSPGVSAHQHYHSTN